MLLHTMNHNGRKGSTNRYCEKMGFILFIGPYFDKKNKQKKLTNMNKNRQRFILISYRTY